MKAEVDFQQVIRTPVGSFRYVHGEYDPEAGVIWIEAVGQALANQEFTAVDQIPGKRVGVVVPPGSVITQTLERPAAVPAGKKAA